MSPSLTPLRADEVVARIFDAFGAHPRPPGVERELRRFFTNNPEFDHVLPLERAGAAIRDGAAGNFVYHQRTQMFFAGVPMGHHQALMAVLSALHRTNFAAPPEPWGPEAIYAWNARAKLADEFVEQGRGLYKSSVGAAAIRVARDFAWTAQERQVFRVFARIAPDE